MAGTLIPGGFGSALSNIGNAMAKGYAAQDGGGSGYAPQQQSQQQPQTQTQAAPQPVGMDFVHQLISHILGGGGAAQPYGSPMGNYLGRMGQP